MAGRNRREPFSEVELSQCWLSEGLCSWIDGFLLGDGHLAITSSGNAARASMGCAERGWCEYALSGFGVYKPREPKMSLVMNKEKMHKTWQSNTLAHPDLLFHHTRWYRMEEGKYNKRIPEDITVTPTSLLLWYLGDGSYSNGDVTLAAYDFTEEENVLLASRFNDVFGLHLTPHLSHGEKKKLYLPASDVHKFFDIVGREDPTGCYPYKFFQRGNVVLRKGKVRGRRIDALQRFCQEHEVTHAWASYILKQGRVEFEKIGGIVCLTENGKKQLEEIIRTEYHPRDGSERETFTQEQVLKELRVHPRRMKKLRDQSGIDPVQTHGGQWRYTREEVELMRSFAEKRHSDPTKNRR